MAQKKKKSITYTVNVNAAGTRRWCVNGMYHREDGPAVEWSDGDKEWWIRNKLHRVGGPAIEMADGQKEWWLNNKLHRKDGPAIEYPSGNKRWFINGKEFSEANFLKRTQKKKPSCGGKIVEIEGKKYKLIPA